MLAFTSIFLGDKENSTFILFVNTTWRYDLCTPLNVGKVKEFLTKLPLSVPINIVVKTITKLALNANENLRS